MVVVVVVLSTGTSQQLSFRVRELIDAVTTISKRVKNQSKLLSSLAERLSECDLLGGWVVVVVCYESEVSIALAMAKGAQDVSELTD